MTKPNFTSINVVLDKSGSMATVMNDTIGGFNTFIADQKTVKGEAVFTLVTFNDKADTIYNAVPLKEVSDISAKSYKPSGCTALLDALGETIDNVGKKLAAMKEEDRPDRVIFVVMTDGQENASKTYTKARVMSMIEQQKNVYKWEFVFMGTDIASINDAEAYGFMRSNTYQYAHNSAGVARGIDDVSKSMRRYRLLDVSDYAAGDFFGKKDSAKDSK